MQNLNGFQWTKIELNKSQIKSHIFTLMMFENDLSLAGKLNLHSYNEALAETKKLNFSIDDTIEFEIITRQK